MTSAPSNQPMWQIEAAEYRRHEARRGRRHAFEPLPAKRSALVVVDMISFFVEESTAARATVEPISRLAASMRSAGAAVAWIVPAVTKPNERDIEFYGRDVATTYALSGGEGPVEQRLWPGLGFSPRDLFFEKAAPSALFPGRCGLEAELTRRGIDTLVIAGTVANVCVESTVRDAFTLGYRPIVVADGVAAPSIEILNATLRTVYRSFGDVRSSDELIALFDTGPK
ncbi:MAG: isochorismatase family cysteine hydrolase [Acidimicrobiales bacterium]|nr:cysteine hydrolase [Acidimicrobiales bacterium]